MFAIEEDKDKVFPLAFEVISEAQQSNNQLVRVTQANQDYSTKSCFAVRSSITKTKLSSPKPYKIVLSNGTPLPYYTLVLPAPPKVSIDIFGAKA
jgi:hypothetical protein